MLTPTSLPTIRLTPPTPVVLDRARAGDADALTTLFEAHGERAYAIACRLLGSADDAHDVVQDVWIGLPEALGSFAGRGTFDAWLYRIVVRLCLTRLRSRRRRREQAMPDDDGVLPAARAMDGPEAVLDRLTVEQALAALPDHLRAVVVLREIEGYTHAEIATMLGLRRGTSEVHLFRARAMLRTLLRGSR